jgi:hypothetical protein
LSRLRVTIAGLMAVVLLIAVGCAALLRPSARWAGVLDTLAMVTVSIAILGAAVRRGPNRGIWLGAAVFGGVYAVLGFGVFSDSTRVKPEPSAILDLLFHPLSGSLRGEPRIRISGRHHASPAMTLEMAKEYERISHSVALILFTLLGAGAGRLLGNPTYPPMIATIASPDT